MKVIIDKFKVYNINYLKSLDFYQKKTGDKKTITAILNNLTQKLPSSSTMFTLYIPNISVMFDEKLLAKKEFKKASFFLKA